MIKQPQILVLIPSASAVEPECLASVHSQNYETFSVLVHYMKPAPAGELKDRPLYSENSTRNRQALRKMALASDADYFLFVDDDTVLPPNAIKNLVRQRKPLIFGWYRMIARPIWVAACWVRDRIVRYRAPQKSVARVNMGGLGCALMSRDVLAKIDFTSGVSIVTKTEEGECYAGPCLDFCMKAQEKGFASYMCGDVICGHVNRKTGAVVC